MGKKSTLKKRKYRIKVKSTNRNKNENKIVIKIDNSTKRKQTKKRKRKIDDDKPVVQQTYRFFNDIGDHTREIERRNAAIQQERLLNAQSTQRLGIPVQTTAPVPAQATAPVPATPAPLTVAPQSTRLGKPLFSPKEPDEMEVSTPIDPSLVRRLKRPKGKFDIVPRRKPLRVIKEKKEEESEKPKKPKVGDLSIDDIVQRGEQFATAGLLNKRYSKETKEKFRGALQVLRTGTLTGGGIDDEGEI